MEQVCQNIDDWVMTVFHNKSLKKEKKNGTQKIPKSNPWNL